MQGENEVAIYGNSVLAVDLQRIAALEARVSLLLKHAEDLMLYVAKEQALRAELFGPQVPTQSDAAFPERALKWSV
jgi:hypothetical protein